MTSIPFNEKIRTDRALDQPPLALTDTIYNWLHAAILDGTFPPGHLLRQEELAARFGASRVPLREALRQLQAEGLVVLRPRRGYAVSHMDPREIVEVLQLRMLVEGYLGYVATQARTVKDIKALEGCVREMDKLPMRNPTNDQIARWSALNLRFHDTLGSATRRPHLRQIAANVQAKIVPYIRIEVAMVSTLEESHAQHHQILEAFRAGDADRVAIISRKHCEATALRFVAALREKGFLADLSSQQLTDLGPAAAVVERRRPEQERKKSRPAQPRKRIS